MSRMSHPFWAAAVFLVVMALLMGCPAEEDIFKKTPYREMEKSEDDPITLVRNKRAKNNKRSE